MNLFFSNFSETENEMIINENDSRHILKSYRRDIGDIIHFTNGNGLLAECKIIEKGKKIKVKIVKLSKRKPNFSNSHFTNSFSVSFSESVNEKLIAFLYVFFIRKGSFPEPLIIARSDPSSISKFAWR